MNIRLIFTLIFISALLLASSCKSSSKKDETTPQMSKSMLKLRGYKVNEEGFLKAVGKEDLLSVRAFINAGINPNSKNSKGETALNYAIQNNESDKVAKFLINKADISMQDDLGNSPLHLSIIKNKDKLFDLILKKGVNVNVAGREGKVKNITPLYAAVLLKREEIVKKLLKKDADPNISDNEDSFPLIDAVFQPAANPETVKLLLEKGAEVNKKNKDGAHALIYAASNQDVTPDVRQAIVKLLLEKGADTKIKNNDGQNALYWAKKLKNEKIVELLGKK